MNSKRLGTFREFLKQQRIKQLKEQKVTLEIEWWDDCILEVKKDLEDECNGFLDYDNLLSFVKNKYKILGREEPGYEEELLLQHIKDLIFQHHWDSLVFDGKCSYGDNSAEIQALGLAVSQLAKEILDKVLDTIKTSDDPVPGTTSIGVVDNNPVEDCGDEYFEDLPIGYENKVVMGMGKYTKMIKEAKQQFRLTKQEKLINHTLKKIEQEAGSLDLEAIAKKVVDKYGIFPEKEGHTMFSKYIKNIVLDYIDKKNLIQTLVTKGEDIYIPVNTADGIYDLFANMVTDEIIDFLTDNNKKEGEDEEVK